MIIASNNRRVILHIIDNLSVGGAELLLKNTLELLPEFIHIVVYLNKPAELSDSFRRLGVELICLGHNGWKSLFTSIRKLKRIIKERKPILVHSHLFQSTICARLATPRYLPLISTLHSIYSIDAFTKNRKSIWAERITLRNRHTLVGVSAFVLKDYLKYIPFQGKKYVLYNFLPETFYENKPLTHTSTGRLKCVAVGNLKEAKNYHYLLDIFSDLKDKDISLDIYGQGPLRPELQARIDQETLPVKLCGRSGQIQDVLKEYDLFIQASEHEGFGLSVIEAMAAGLPVFLSDIAVFHEVANGYAHFFPLQNSLKATDLLQELKNDTVKRMKYVKLAFTHCQFQYNERTYRDRLLKIYNDVTSLF